MPYDPSIGKIICMRVADGDNLKQICKDNHIPSHSMVYEWRNECKEFDEMYSRAREMRAESRVERIDSYKDMMLSRKITSDVARVAIDTEKWQAGKENIKYSDRLVLAGDKDNPLQFVATRLDEAIARRNMIDVTPERVAIENNSDDI